MASATGSGPDPGPRVHLIEGPVGAGKSTYAAALARRHGGVALALDDWFARLFSADRPPGPMDVQWYAERKQRLLALMWRHSLQILHAGRDVVLELGLVQRRDRRAFCRQVRADGWDPIVHGLDAPRDVRRARVRRRNAEQGPTFAMVVPDAVFERASDLWEPPDDDERAEFTIIDVALATGGG